MRLAHLVLLVVALFFASGNAFAATADKEQPEAVSVTTLTIKRFLRSVEVAEASDEDSDEERAASVPAFSKIGGITKKGSANVNMLIERLKYKFWRMTGKTDEDIFLKWIAQGKSHEDMYKIWLKEGFNPDKVYRAVGLHRADVYASPYKNIWIGYRTLYNNKHGISNY
ncbi:hypothetical protein PR003_g19125 [Phytophthora rubi]|uniref:RxLR effector protein n=1 Tax=Phytophthora rubi TaxID=129364 RepID=A0A6A3N149_9STRA|nr:hypothetical protein PR002_g7962 [Phytophthora rubi]KAE9039096.1 hypothetical protein PR001_g7662 [Phytophthora rubi]KAE9314891.1 hypothetical protein PR003_g19125 [Phytophthora rubi]